MCCRAPPPKRSTRSATTSSPRAAATPAPLGYKGFPKSICTSPNHVVCHGIPGPRRLRDGDILNIDVTVILDGWHGDTSRMFLVGERVGVKARRLVAATHEAMMRGIETVRPGSFLGDIGHAIQSHVEPMGFSVVRDFCGHGLGREFHQPPSVMHFGRPGDGPMLREGMFFTIEPMINAGRAQVKILADNWTAVTRDRSLSAQFEHTVAVVAGRGGGADLLAEGLGPAALCVTGLCATGLCWAGPTARTRSASGASACTAIASGCAGSFWRACPAEPPCPTIN